MPYPFSKTMAPFLSTATAQPGVVAVYDLKTESIFRVIESGRDCDKTVKGMRKAVVRVLKKGMSDHDG